MIHRAKAVLNELITIGYRRLNGIQTSIKLSSVVLFLFLINYGLLGFGLPWSLESFSGLFNQLRIAAFVLTAFVSFAIISNGLKQNDKRIQVTANQFILAMVATTISFLSRGAIYSTSLNGDELAYLANSSFHSIKVGALISDKISPLTQTSVSGMFSLQQLSLLGFLVIICCLTLMLRLIKSNRGTRVARAS